MTIKETADKLAAEYAAQYDDGKWREYAEEDFYTRIEYGWHFAHLGKSFQLQRRRWWGWRSVAWTYGTNHHEDISYIQEYLLWYEKTVNK